MTSRHSGECWVSSDLTAAKILGRTEIFIVISEGFLVYNKAVVLREMSGTVQSFDYLSVRIKLAAAVA